AGVAGRVRGAHGHKLVLLAGPSASGKTTTAQKLADALCTRDTRAHRISLDDFYLEAGRMPCLPDGSPDIESVHALDLPLLRDTLRSLMETGRGDIPHFKFGAGGRTRYDPLALGPEDTIVLEGLHALHPEITGATGFPAGAVTKVYVSVASRIYDKREIVINKRNLRLVRRVLRDHQFRGSDAAKTIAMWPAVTRGEEQWLTPCKPHADFLINSIHVYEPCVFAPRVLPLLESVPAGATGAGAAYRLAKSLRRFAPLPETMVSPDSLLREFLGNA
ncbi:MAG: nucleoside kinase, partial [Oscillospiraceae bacterium]|nr:nucleoside kinase [Oscillospiraceae bacterium]